MERRVGQMNWPDAREVLRIWQRELVLRPSRPYRRSGESAWSDLARRSLRHDRVLWKLSVLLTATWMRLARGVLRIERARLAAVNAQAAYDKIRGGW